MSDHAIRFVGLPSPTAPRAGAGGHPCQGLYREPRGRPPRAALIATHYNVDFSEHYLGPAMAARGFGFLGWNTRYRGAEDQFRLEHALIDIGQGVRWLREAAAVESMVMLGNSGGGSLMAAYQAEALQPTLSLAGAGGEALAALPPADLYVSLNAHRGRPDVLTDWLDPSVTDETDPLSRAPSLDPFDPAHGPPFEPAFVARYRAAQRDRNARITQWAQAELGRLQAAGTPDRIFPLFRAWADLRFLDPALDPSDRPPGRCYAGDPRAANARPGLGRASSLSTWLSMWSLETSRCRGELHLPRIAAPSLVVQSLSDVGVFPSDARAIHGLLGSTDRRLAFVPGAHYFEDSPANLAAVADLIAGWIEDRL